jgi:hypothetical protein
MCVGIIIYTNAQCKCLRSFNHVDGGDVIIVCFAFHYLCFVFWLHAVLVLVVMGALASTPARVSGRAWFFPAVENPFGP